MPFSCQGPGGVDLCFEGGVCASDGLSCICPSTWQHDLSFWHASVKSALQSIARGLTSVAQDNNCVLPEGGYLYPLLVSSFVVAVNMARVARHLRNARNRVKLMLWLTLGNLASIWLISLGTFLEDGWFHAAAFFHFAQLVLFTASMQILLSMIVLPIFSLDKILVVHVERGIRSLSVGVLVLQGAPIVVMFATCRSFDYIDSYNNAATSFFLALPLLMCFGSCLSLRATSLLRAQIERNGNTKLESDKGDERGKVIIAKIIRIRANAWRQFPSFPIVLAFPLAHIILGSTPWHYIPMWFHVSLGFATVAGDSAIALVHRVAAKGDSIVNSTVKSSSKSQGQKPSDASPPVYRFKQIAPPQSSNVTSTFKTNDVASIAVVSVMDDATLRVRVVPPPIRQRVLGRLLSSWNATATARPSEPSAAQRNDARSEVVTVVASTMEGDN